MTNDDVIVGLFVKIFLASLCADSGDTALAEKLLNASEGETMDEEDESLIDIFAAWTEIKYDVINYVIIY